MHRPPAYQAWANRQLADDKLHTLCADINDLFWNEYPTRVQDEFHYHVSMLSRFFGGRLSVDNLYISPYNVKVLPAVDGYELVVTDLALYIDRLPYQRVSGSGSSRAL